MNKTVHVILAVLVCSLAVIGCQEQLASVDPVTPEQQPAGILSSLVSWLPLPNSGLSLLALPQSRGTMQYVTSTSIVNPETSTRITARYSYVSTLGKIVSINACITFPPGAVKEQTRVTIGIDTVRAGLIFGPEGIEFRKDVYVDYTISGLGIIDQILNPIDFYYWTEEGHCERIDRTSLRVDFLRGTITLDDARLKHFSQYAFGRRSAE